MIYKTGEPVQFDMTSNHRCVWHVPRVEMKRVGIHHLNGLDRIYDPVERRWWQPEGPTNITEKLFRNMYRIDCERIDPPMDVAPYGPENL